MTDTQSELREGRDTWAGWFADVRAKFQLPPATRDLKDYWTGYEDALQDAERQATALARASTAKPSEAWDVLREAIRQAAGAESVTIGRPFALSLLRLLDSLGPKMELEARPSIVEMDALTLLRQGATMAGQESRWWNHRAWQERALAFLTRLSQPDAAKEAGR
jgi:hypothetical protein